MNMCKEVKPSSCFECGKPSHHEHHVVPRVYGGTKTVPLCALCHGRVHGTALDCGALTSMAMQQKRARLEYTGGKVRYGYRVADDGVHLVEDEAEQAIIRRIMELRDDGLSYRAISRQLAEEKFETRTGKPMKAAQVRGLSRTGRPFNHSAVHNIIKRGES